MNHRIFIALPLMVLILLAAVAAQAEAPKKYAVLPFTVNGPDKYEYLSKGVQDMLVSRLHWQDHMHSIDQGALQGMASSQVSEADAPAMATKLLVDYLVWGSVTIMGEECSIDLKVYADGDIHPQAVQTELDKVIPAIELLAGKINSQVVGRTGTPSSDDSPEQVNAMNPELVFNERDSNQEFYLNPQFRYSGDVATEGRIRSRSLPFNSIDIAVGDADGDGTTEIFLLEDVRVNVFRFDMQNNLIPVTEYEIGYILQNINMNLFDTNGDGRKELVISAMNQDLDPRSYILQFDNEKLSSVQESIRLFLNVVRLPPHFKPTLVASKGHRDYLFAKGVFEAVKMGGEYQAGREISLPPEANAFNFCYLPTDEGYKILISDSNDRIRVYTHLGDRQYTTDQKYSGSALGAEIPESIGGMVDDELIAGVYYFPLRMTPINLDGDEHFELLVNKPISTAAQFFERYRFYPQGEVQALTWDGVGLNLVWKTRRIKGSVTGYGLGDVNNDGIMDLYVLINTHPGALGVDRRRSIVLAYPLDLEAQDPDAFIDNQFREDEY